MDKCNVLWRPCCSCSTVALEPNEDCWLHGAPDPRRCPNCGQFRGRKPCKRCECAYGIDEPASVPACEVKPSEVSSEPRRTNYNIDPDVLED